MEYSKLICETFFMDQYRYKKERNGDIKMRELRTIVSNNRNNRELADKINHLAQEWKEKAAIPKPNIKES